MVQRHKITQFFTAHDHQDAHALRLRAGDEVRPLVAPGPRLRGRTHQPRGLALVLRDRRRSSLPHHGHLLADGDRRLHDDANARQPCVEARLLRTALLGCRRKDPRCSHGERARGQRRLGIAGVCQILAGDDAHGVWQSRADAGCVLEAVPGVLLYGRRLRPRHRWLLLDHRPRGRRHQRFRPPHRQRGGGACPRRARALRRGGRGRISPCGEGLRPLRLRDLESGRRRRPHVEGRVESLRAEGRRTFRDAGPDLV
mmetsp:Transcript_51875/g.150999  ORF Transcript_51875/g.150999 Transcript_51875/m.150999 type:complete len:256 (-) Transcript_51875:711-1478(-)